MDAGRWPEISFKIDQPIAIMFTNCCMMFLRHVAEDSVSSSAALQGRAMQQEPGVVTVASKSAQTGRGCSVRIDSPE